MKWLFLVVLHFNWFYTVMYFTCLLWIFDRGKLGKSLFSKHDRHTPSRIAIKISSIKIEGNLKFKFCPYKKILLQFPLILRFNDLWSKHTSCIDDAVCLYSMAVVSKRDFALLWVKSLDSKLIKTLKSDVYTRICTQLTFDLILGLGGISRLGIHPYPS